MHSPALSPKLNDDAEPEEPMAKKAKVKAKASPASKVARKANQWNTKPFQYLARPTLQHLTGCSTRLGHRAGNWYQRYPKTRLHFLYSNARAACALSHRTPKGNNAPTPDNGDRR